MRNEAGLILYRSREWALALEIYIAVEAVVVGAVGSLRNGALGVALHFIQEYYLWTLLFCSFGGALVVVTAFEVRCRLRGGDERCMRRFAIAREWLNLVLIPCWLFAAVLYFITDLVLVPALAGQCLIAAFLIHLENVRAQHKCSKERRSDRLVAMHHVSDMGS